MVHLITIYFHALRIDGKPFYVQKVVLASGGSNYINIYALETDNTYTLLGNGGYSGTVFVLNRKVQGIRKYYGSVSTCNSGSVYVYACSAPFKYRISGGKLYQQDMSSIDWTPVQKIKLGTADIYNGEICNLSLRSAASMQWMTDGNNLSTI